MDHFAVAKDLVNLRTDLAQARLSELETEREFKDLTVRCECNIAERVQLGSNEAERKRNMQKNLLTYREWVAARDAAETATAARITLEAKLEALLDTMRLERLLVLDRLSVALGGVNPSLGVLVAPGTIHDEVPEALKPHKAR